MRRGLNQAIIVPSGHRMDTFGNMLTRRINLKEPHIGAAYCGAICAKVPTISKNGESLSEILCIRVQIRDQRSSVGWVLSFLRTTLNSVFELVHASTRRFSCSVRPSMNLIRAFRKTSLGRRHALATR
jgi:hypothetical protein